ncbi:hypothetical protein FH972_000829 [Carpinus fangiana]|uniref:Uncharacterized protein n=1 Tax=Carpinus fangiana TaxID=176857 RepID=A0A5N6QCY6_9ROSI|nr:hypothetical protein FH972_000829 [Carpinus fangiana]
MANQLGGRLRSARSRIVEEFVPYSGWTEDAKAHHLLIDLPLDITMLLDVFLITF